MKNAITLVAVMGSIILGIRILDATPAHKEREDNENRPVAGQDFNAAQVNIGQDKVELTDAERKYRADYPELFKQKAFIVAISADWCVPCRTQAFYTKALEGRYHVIKYDYDKKRGKDLYDRFGGEAIPFTGIIVEGKLKKKFEGKTPPGKIEPFAAEARKVQNEDDETRSDRHIWPWWNPNTRDDNIEDD